MPRDEKHRDEKQTHKTTNRVSDYFETGRSDASRYHLALDLMDHYALLSEIIIEGWEGTQHDVDFHHLTIERFKVAQRIAEVIECEGK